VAAAKISAVKDGHIYSPGLPALSAFLPCQPACFVLCQILALVLVKVDFLPNNIPSAFYFSEISMGETLQLILWQL
jgi:hypothetical protein